LRFKRPDGATSEIRRPSPRFRSSRRLSFYSSSPRASFFIPPFFPNFPCVAFFPVKTPRFFRLTVKFGKIAASSRRVPFLELN
jgi:hypothetical protein